MFDLVIANPDHPDTDKVMTANQRAAWWYLDATTRAWCPTQGNARQALDRGQIRKGGCIIDDAGNPLPLLVSPNYILEHRPTHSIDVDLQGGTGPGGAFPAGPVID